MMVLVSGGAGSGKSACAESIAERLSDESRVYLATMQVWGEEDRQRVARHREMRKNKGFQTVEKPSDIGEVEIPPDCTVLLEDLSNVSANECFGGKGFDGAENRILNGIDSLQKRSKHLIIVTNELFSDGICYPAETQRYLALLALLNRELASRADVVIESVVGIPVFWKGKKDELF